MASDADNVNSFWGSTHGYLPTPVVLNYSAWQELLDKSTSWPHLSHDFSHDFYGVRPSVCPCRSRRHGQTESTILRLSYTFYVKCLNTWYLNIHFLRPMRCFVGPRCCLLPHVAWFACLCLLWGVGPIATNDTPIMGSLSVCLCCFVCLFFHQKPARFYPCFCTCIEVCDAAYCYSVPHGMVCVLFCAFSATCTVYFYWWHTYYGQSVCLSVSLVALSVCLFHQKPARFYPYVSVHVSRSAMRPIATVSHMAWSVYYIVHFPLRVRSTSTDDTRIMVSLSVCLCPWLVCMSVISI